VELHRAHDEMKTRRLFRGLFEQFALVDAEQPDEIRAPALHEAQVARVINEAREIRVLVIDADRQPVLAIDDLSRQMMPVAFARSHSAPRKYLPELKDGNYRRPDGFLEALRLDRKHGARRAGGGPNDGIL